MTYGAQGAIAFTASNFYEIKAVPVAKVVDSTGAGDVFTAGFISSLLESPDLSQALARAVDWAQHALTHASSIPNERA